MSRLLSVVLLAALQPQRKIANSHSARGVDVALPCDAARQTVKAWHFKVDRNDILPLKAISDIAEAVQYHSLWVAMAWEDLRQRYRRTVFGFLWLTLSFLAFIAAKFFVFSTMNSVDGAFSLSGLSSATGPGASSRQ